MNASPYTDICEASSERSIIFDVFPRLIGRGGDCDYQLSDRVVSRHHCRIFDEDGEVWLIDLDSRNGTYLNGQQLEMPHVLTTGDRVEIGPYVFRCWLDEDILGQPLLKLEPIH